MPRDLILGTAGHIDHGKTSLVKALTGTDCDRLPEEKQRGITIDIGFAKLELGDFNLGIVDVPGHERFIKNMLAGSTGIDLVVLIVAADDGVMPQTREHLEILKLLGVRQGLIALTKSDLVDEITREVVCLEIRDLVQDSFLADAPIIETSAISGVGLQKLQEQLLEVCKQVVHREGEEWFRLPVDRAFVVQGHGTVVTGSVASGKIRIGDQIDWHQGNGSVETVRVRGLSNHGMPVAEVHRGQRAGVNLVGVPHDAVRRGQEVCTSGFLVPSRVLTVRLSASHAIQRQIKHRLPVRLHVGTAEVLAKVSLLDADSLDPGTWGLGQLFLEEPVTVVWGQPFVLRDSSAEHTVGGGQVLQPDATKIRRRHVESLTRVAQLWSEDAQQRVEIAIWFKGFKGLVPGDIAREAGVPSNEIEAVLGELLSSKRVVELVLPPHHKLVLHADRVSELETRILDTLGGLHAENPLMTSHDRQKTLACLDYIESESLLQTMTERLLKAKKVVGDQRRIARSDFKPKLSANQRKLKDKIVEAHLAAGFQPPEPKEFANQAAGNAAALKDIFDVAVAEGLLVKITDELFLAADADVLMRTRVLDRLKSSGATVAEIRDVLGTTRKYAVPLCEYLDRIGVTRRVGDLRVVAEPTPSSAIPQ